MAEDGVRDEDPARHLRGGAIGLCAALRGRVRPEVVVDENRTV